MGSLAKGFLRKVYGNSAENSRKIRFIAPGKDAEILRKVLRKFRGNLRKIFCNDPFPNDPISELLRKREVFGLETPHVPYYMVEESNCMDATEGPLSPTQEPPPSPFWPLTRTMV